MSRILNETQVQMAARGAVGYGVRNEGALLREMPLTPEMEAILTEQDRVTKEAVAREIFTDLEIHKTDHVVDERCIKLLKAKYGIKS